MAILGLGTDIVEIDRVAKIVERSGERLAKRILTLREFDVYQQHEQPIRFLAKRFAVKEAAAKALGTGMRNGISFNHFDVEHNELGKPQLKLHDIAAQQAEKMGVNHLHLSLSDERRYASATVILES